MPDAILVSVAKAVTKELNAGSAAGDFVMRFDAERSYADWDEMLADGELHVDVVPVGPDNPRVDLETRGSWEYQVLVDVGVRKRLGPQEQQQSDGKIVIAEVDQLVLLLQQIGEYFMPKQSSADGRGLTDIPEATWEPMVIGQGRNETGSIYRASYAREALMQRQYTGVVRIAFKVPF